MRNDDKESGTSFFCQSLKTLHTGTVCTSFGGFGSNAYLLFAARLLLLGLQLLLSLSYYFGINSPCVGILFKIVLVFAGKTIRIEHCSIFLVFAVS